MKITTLNVVMFSAGAILVYCGIKGYDPRDVIQWGLGGKKPKTMAAKKKDAETPKVNPKDHPGDMPWTYPDDKGSPASDAGGSGNAVQV
jgi:hypothetical protein